jgi:hypothetical protein
MVYGAAMGSFAVEAFGVQRFEQVTVKDVEERVQGFLQLTQFEVSRPGQ